MTPLIATLAACALTLSIVHSRGLPESSDKLEACGQHYGALLKASTTWNEKECNGSTKLAACVVSEHEQAYRELKQRCQEAHDERTAKVNAIYEKLPAYLSEVSARVNVLQVSLQHDLPNLQEMVGEQRHLIEQAWQYGAQLQHELMLTSMESDRVQRALVLHSMLVNASLAEMVKESYQTHGADGRMVVRMLKFVRLLPGADERVAVYKQLAELLKSNGQDGRFPAVIFSTDVRQLEDRYKPDHAQYEGKVVERWLAELQAGTFHEVVEFARDYPEYFARVEEHVQRVAGVGERVELLLQRLLHLLLLLGFLLRCVQLLLQGGGVLAMLLLHLPLRIVQQLLTELAGRIGRWSGGCPLLARGQVFPDLVKLR